MSLTCQYNLTLGARPVTSTILNKLSQMTKQPPHQFLTSGAVSEHKNFDNLLSQVDQGHSFYILTGRGPSSSSLHLGHVIPFEVACYFQRVFKVPCVIQISDDEKFLTRKVPFKAHVLDTIRDVLAFGFNLEQTFICVNTQYLSTEPAFYLNTLRLGACISLQQAKVIFNHQPDTSLGSAAYPLVQAVAALASTFPKVLDPSLRCLVICSTDQDVFFRMLRQAIYKGQLKEPPPALLYCSLLPTFEDPNYKMSSSGRFSNILLSDHESVIKSKLDKVHPKVKHIYVDWFQNQRFILNLIREHQHKKSILTQEDLNTSCTIRRLS